MSLDHARPVDAVAPYDGPPRPHLAGHRIDLGLTREQYARLHMTARERNCSMQDVLRTVVDKWIEAQS